MGWLPQLLPWAEPSGKEAALGAPGHLGQCHVGGVAPQGAVALGVPGPPASGSAPWAMHSKEGVGGAQST